VPKERADEFFQAAKDPREIKWYESGHGLNESATADRKTWLKKNLALKV
jgi:predicted esterase